MKKHQAKPVEVGEKADHAAQWRCRLISYLRKACVISSAAGLTIYFFLARQYRDDIFFFKPSMPGNGLESFRPYVHEESSIGIANAKGPGDLEMLYHAQYALAPVVVTEVTPEALDKRARFMILCNFTPLAAKRLAVQLNATVVRFEPAACLLQFR